ncbi:MAG: SDR family NAD(P)-dependent oxidoreductase [Candidatus Aenigmarchaeota archaeon]|nr:SDR family NAD(P)-dependent oxidoreductase [Candidatus Aenigmarchaeota archaeon]
MKNVVVTGGCGFIGSHLVEALLKKGMNVTVFDKADAKKSSIAHLKDVNVIRGDVTKEQDVLKACKGADTIFHLSAVVGVKNYVNDPLGTIDVNIIGTRNVVAAATKENAKLLFTSTSEIFGKNPKVPWKEEDDRVLGATSVARWTYSTSKSMCEHMIFSASEKYGFPATIVRYFNAYGPRQAPIFVVPAAIHRVLNGKPPIIYDGGKPTRCFTYVEDAISGTIAAAESASGEAFNLGSMKETNLNELVKIILKETGREDLGVEYVDTKKLYGASYEDIPRRVPDATKAKRVLGWSATTPLSEGIRKTVAWCRENREWLNG